VVGGPQGDCGLTGRKIIVDLVRRLRPPRRRRRLLGEGPVEGRSERRLRWRATSRRTSSRPSSPPSARCSSPTRSASPSRFGPGRTFGTGNADDKKISTAVRDLFDLKPAGIIKSLALKKPIYQRTASYGHFGRTPTAITSPGNAPIAADLRSATK
jgi:S-adenosylmethionine synthetase